MISPFQRFANTRGGEYIPTENDPWGAFQLDAMRSSAKFITNKWNEAGIKRTLSVGFVNQTLIGGSASRLEYDDIIALTWGASRRLTFIIHCLVIQPDMKSAYFDQVSESFLDSDQYIRATQVQDMVRLSGIHPMSDEKTVDAKRLHTACMRYIFFHELAHIQNGHLNLVSGDCSISETGQDEGIRKISNLARQTLEWDADLSAGSEMLSTYLEPTINFDVRPNTWTFPNLERSDLIKSVNLVTSSICLCQFLFFQSMAKGESPRYPRPAFRYLYNINNLINNFSVRTDLDEKFIGEIIDRAFLEISYRWYALTGQDYFYGLTNLIGNEEYIILARSYTDTWADMYEKLEKHSRVSIAPARP